MTDCVSLETLESYRLGLLPQAGEVAVVDAHLAECTACRSALRALVLSAAPALATHLTPEANDPACLDEDLIRRYAEEQADEADREIVEAHIDLCARCREDVDSLRSFHRKMQTFDWSTVGNGSTRSPGGARTSPVRSLIGFWSRLSLSGRILIALALGTLTGLIFGRRVEFFQPVSTGILSLLGAVATPLIFIGLIHTLMRTEVNGRIAGKLIGLLFGNSLVAVCFGWLVVRLWQPGRHILLTEIPPPGPSPFHAPGSLLEPLISNNLLVVIFLACGFGFALRAVRQEQIRAGQPAYRALEDVLETLYRCLLRLLQWVIDLVPIAVFASGASIVSRYGHRPYQFLGGFAVAVLAALLLQALYYATLLRFASRISPLRLLRGVRSALLTAFSTASSAATMPVTYERVTSQIALREESASLGVLVGGSINRDGTAMFEVIGVFFLVQALGLTLGPGLQVAVLLLAVAASIAAPGVPETGLVTMTLIFQTLSIPQAAPYIVLLLPLDWLLDRCRTVINVLGHVTVACLLDDRARSAVDASDQT